MTTAEILEYIETRISGTYKGYTTASDELTTSEGGDGRFFGKVMATRYSGLPKLGHIFVAIGETVEKVQIIKLGRISECLRPDTEDHERRWI